jgi:hypothetical protein
MSWAPLDPASRISRQAFSIEACLFMNTGAACTAATLTLSGIISTPPFKTTDMLYDFYYFLVLLS